MESKSGNVSSVTKPTVYLSTTRSSQRTKQSAIWLKPPHKLRIRRWAVRTSRLSFASTYLGPCVSRCQFKATTQLKAIEKKNCRQNLLNSETVPINICQTQISNKPMSPDFNAFRLRSKTKLNKWLSVLKIERSVLSRSTTRSLFLVTEQRILRPLLATNLMILTICFKMGAIRQVSYSTRQLKKLSCSYKRRY